MPGITNYMFDIFVRSVNTLDVDTHLLPAGTGGTVNFLLDAGASNAGRNDLLLGSVTGIAPGFPLPGPLVVVSIHWDFYTRFVFAATNTPVFSNFMGALDASGTSTATLNTFGPIPPEAVGLITYYAYALNGPWNFASNPAVMEMVP